jgi:hypothetical protein
MGNTATETFQLMKKSYGDSTVSHTWVFEWYAGFQDSRENLEGDKCIGRPAAI